MSPYGLNDTLHILQMWIIQVKPEGPAMPLKITMVFLLLLYLYFYGLNYLFWNSEWLKSLKSKHKIGTLI